MGQLNPFASHPMRRYHYAWMRLANRTGRHLDVGCGCGDFLGELSKSTSLECYGVDPHPGYLKELHARYPAIPIFQIPTVAALDFSDGFFQSASLLDVLEHVPDERAMLVEVHRVLVPGGLLVLSVPARHIFSFLDPDNAKFLFPRFHRLVYTARFGAPVYYERFVDLSNGLRGDMSLEKAEHTNYRPQELLELLFSAGFRCMDRDGANLFWRWFHVPSLLAGPRLKRILEQAILWDAKSFRAANLFLTMERV
jgi:ubiquinone/menaquinone biosynthesis C-methylase UbiE